MRLIVHAPNVHSGGGRTLLLAALRGVSPALSCRLVADARLDTSALPPAVTSDAFAPTLAGRFAAELHLHRTAATDDVVLCMGNLPPLLSCAARVSVFVHNRYLCESLSLGQFPLTVRARIRVERQWLRRRLRPSMSIVVQTASMQAAVRRGLGRGATVMPFAELGAVDLRAAASDGRPRFLYPASAEPHKNHMALLAAWRSLAGSGVDAELHLTVAPGSAVAAAVERARAEGTPIVNHGPLEPAALARLYASCTALVFPSHLESFGLPLLEAQAAGLAIVAAERDYVRDLVRPTETFDPESPVSIARAVRRSLGLDDGQVIPMAPSQFIAEVVGAR